MVFSVVPFITASILLRLILTNEPAPVTRFFLDSFGKSGALILLGMVLVLEILLFARLTAPVSGFLDRVFPGTDKEKSRAEDPQKKNERRLALPEPLTVSPRRTKKRKDAAGPELEESGEKEAEIAGDDAAGGEPAPFRLPDIRELPELKSLRKNRTEGGADSQENPESDLLDESAARGRAGGEKPADLPAAELVDPEDSRGSFAPPPAAEQTDPNGSAAPDAPEQPAPEQPETPSAAPSEPAAPDDPEEAVRHGRSIDYHQAAGELLKEYHDGEYWKIDADTEEAAEVLTSTLKEFKIEAEVTGIRKGPVITMFEILPAPGVKLSKISNLADNIALRLAASSVRIVAPIPGKHAVGIEVPNRRRAIVSFREMVQDENFVPDEMEIPIALGKDIPGEAQVIDLAQMPHLLIAGATGSGKSVCVNSIICSILFTRSPREVKLMLIDPKIVELKFYNDIAHLMTPVITDPKRAFQALQYCIYEMERRYSLLDALGVRDVRSYNEKIQKQNLATEPLPYIVIIVDEFADLMTTSGKELESTIARLAAMSRAVGIHLVLATQRPSIDVITGLIKANIPARIAFMVASKFDSRIILDSVGAEKLLGRGDMLYISSVDPFPVRIQGAFLSEREVESTTAHIRREFGEPDYIDDDIFIEEEGEAGLFSGEGADPLMDEALQIVMNAGKASASYLQRRLKVGYNRAARLIEEMEERGIVGPANGSKPREILHVPDQKYREREEQEGLF
ncbi:MAG: DNA translocase FtsK [Spirochaetales bacterium]|nr:DNA translocase FtsK [Spirochaetales bacterium]MCF7939066.1 DNA translocase FtsK [Spirochaetales bacterium]